MHAPDGVLGQSARLQAGKEALELESVQILQGFHAAVLQVPLHLLLVPAQSSRTPSQDLEVEQPLAQQRAEQGSAAGPAPIGGFGVLRICSLFVAGRGYTKSPRNCPRAPDRRSSGLRKEQRISRFFHQFSNSLAPARPLPQGPPKTPKPAFLEAGFEFRLRSDPPARKSSANLLTEPA